MATAEQWIKCTQAQKDELNNLYDFRRRYDFRRQRMLMELDKARKLITRKVNHSWGELWVHPVHVRYEAARQAQFLNHWMNTDGAALAHTIANLDKVINEVLREAARGHEQRQMVLVGEMFPGLTTDEQRREALQLLKGKRHDHN